MTLRARLALVKRVPAGPGSSYGHTYTTDARHDARRWCRSATPTASRGPPATRPAARSAGRRHTIAGRVCMDQFVVDLGDRPDVAQLRAGDAVVLFGAGRDGEPTAQDWAEAVDTISYEIVTRIGSRVPRTYVGGAVVRSPSRTVLGSRRRAGRGRRRRRARPGRRALDRRAGGRVRRAARPTARCAARRSASPRTTAPQLHVEVDELDVDGTPTARRPAPSSGDRRVQPRLLPQPGHLALPAAVAARPLPDGVLGPARARPLRRPGPSEHYTIDQCGADLRAVIDAVAPTGPAGARRALDGRHDGDGAGRRAAPSCSRERVVGVALVATSSGGLADVSWGLTGSVSKVAHKVAPGRAGRADPDAAAGRPHPADRQRPRAAAGQALLLRLAGAARAGPVHRRDDRRDPDRRGVRLPARLRPARQGARRSRRWTASRRWCCPARRTCSRPLEHSEAIVRRLPGAEHVARAGRRAHGDARAPGRGEPAPRATCWSGPTGRSCADVAAAGCVVPAGPDAARPRPTSRGWLCTVRSGARGSWQWARPGSTVETAGPLPGGRAGVGSISPSVRSPPCSPSPACPS